MKSAGYACAGVNSAHDPWARNLPLGVGGVAHGDGTRGRVADVFVPLTGTSSTRLHRSLTMTLARSCIPSFIRWITRSTDFFFDFFFGGVVTLRYMRLYTWWLMRSDVGGTVQR